MYVNKHEQYSVDNLQGRVDDALHLRAKYACTNNCKKLDRLTDPLVVLAVVSALPPLHVELLKARS